MKSVSTRMKSLTAVTLVIAAAVVLVAGVAAPKLVREQVHRRKCAAYGPGHGQQ